MTNSKVTVTLAAEVAKFQADMQRAASSTEQAMAKMQTSTSGFNVALAGLAQGVVAALSVNAFAGFIKNTIDAADGINDLSQRVGIAVADLAKYELAASQSGTTMEALAKGIKGMAVNLSEHGKALAAVGITATTSDGAMQQLADVFANMPDGMEKTTLAVKLFGKSGMDLIPMLNQGSEGLAAAAEKSAKYAAVMATLAPVADTFNDNMAELALASKVVGMSLVNDLLPGMVNISQAMAMAAQESGILKAAWVGLGGVMEEYIAKPAAVIFKGINNDLDEANAKMLRFFGQTAEADKLAAAVARRNKEIVAITDTSAPSAPAAPKAFDKTKWMADYQAMMEALKDSNKPSKKARTAKPQKSEAQKLEEDAQRFVARLREQADTLGMSGTAVLEYQMNLSKFPQVYKNEAIALQQRIDAYKASADEDKAFAAATERFMAERERDIQANEANVARIRISLMSETEQQQIAHERILEELQTFHDAKFENVEQANRMIEEENTRHQQVLTDMQVAHDLQSLAMIGNATDQLFAIMKKSGKDQTALGKAVFLASKAIAVAEILINTEVAAAKAGAQLGIFGIPMATMIRATGYASAGMVAGMAIAELSGAREKGGPVWGGGAFLVGEKGPEIFKPTGTGTIIPNSQITGSTTAPMALTIVNQTSGRIDKVTEQSISPTERALIIQESVNATAAALSDANSRPSRAMHRNFAIQRSR